MTGNDNHKLSDDELEDYLDGNHAVSGAYGDLDKASPPEALDARILARARDSVAGKADFSKDVFIRPYATAATVFLCLTITFLLLREPDVPSPADLRSQPAIAERSIPLTAPQESPGAPAEGDRAADAAADNGAEPVMAESLQSLLDLVEQRSMNEPDQAAARQEQGPEVGNATADTASRAPAMNASQVEETLEEITVTGNRLERVATYRDDRDTWLREIARLRAAGETDSAGQEQTLFLERYPDADLEAELAALASP